MFLISILSIAALAVANADVLYDSSTQICCDGVPLDYPDNDQYYTGCCGNVSVLNTWNQICCNNIVVNKLTPNSYCCGNSTTPYDYTTQICCNNNVFNQTYNYNYYSYYYYWSSTYCCGDVAYDSTQQSCCNNQVVKGAYQCYYDSTTCNGETMTTGQICCSDYNSDGTYDYQSVNGDNCCGLQGYDSSTQMCCSTWDNVNGTYTSSYNVTDTPWPTDYAYYYYYYYYYYPSYLYSCCGLQSYLSYNYLCCSAYDSTKQTTTYNLVSLNGQSSYNVQCCGSTTYNPSLGLCCSNYDPKTYSYSYNVVNYPEGSNETSYLQCCGSGVYDYRKQVCCNGQVSDLTNRYIQCCGSQSYDYSKDNRLCCNNEELYDPSTYLCCGDYGSQTLVTKMVPTDTQCCGSDTYNPNKEICCNGAVTDKSSTIDSCCSRNYYYYYPYYPYYPYYTYDD